MNEQLNSNSSMQHRIFRTDTKLTSAEINELLGIKVSLKEAPEVEDSKAKLMAQCNNMFKFALITIGLSSVALLGTMYQLQVGPFYDSEVYVSAKN